MIAPQAPLHGYLSVREVAGDLGVSESKIVTWIRCGQLPAIDVSLRGASGRRPRWRIGRQQLEVFLAARSALVPSPVPRRRRPKQPDVIEFFK